MQQQNLNDFWHSHRPILLFVAIWASFNALQGSWLALDPDEAYYWSYAQRLDWGYFDHPPMVALLAATGLNWLTGSLGVRLGNIAVHAGTIFLFWKYISPALSALRVPTWVPVFLGLPFLHLYGLVATPDGPLLFFSIWYLVLLKQFTEKPGWRLALLWGFVMAALLYSKYHGILVIAFSMSAHWRLWKDPRFWVACIFGALLFLPHLYWQYQHDFPSFRYHLKGRNDPYEPGFTLSYLLNQVFLFSPLMLPLFIRAIWAQRKWNTAVALLTGFWGFFLYASFKGHVEPQWTAVLTFPLAWMALEYCKEKPNYELWLRRTGWASFICIALARIALQLPIPGLKHPLQAKQWPSELVQFAGNQPVVFQNSYRDASEYAYYTGQKAYTFTDVFYRPSQYDIWDDEKRLHNQSALMLLQPGGIVPCPACDTLRMQGKTRLIVRADSLQIAQKVKISASECPKTLLTGKTYPIALQLENPYDHDIFPGKGNLPLGLYAVFLQEGQVDTLTRLSLNTSPPFWPRRGKINLRAELTVPEIPAGAYALVFGIAHTHLPPGWNSPPAPVEVTTR